MKKLIAAAAVAAAVSLTGFAVATPAIAAPPTATVSPGYDARLAESRTAKVAPTDVSSRRYRRYRGYYGPRYYRPYGYGYRPYGYGYNPYYARPYYGGPRVYGPGFGFGFGF